MQYEVISADCGVGLIWLPPDLFAANAPAAFEDRMPCVTDGPRGMPVELLVGENFSQ